MKKTDDRHTLRVELNTLELLRRCRAALTARERRHVTWDQTLAELASGFLSRDTAE